MDTFTIFLTLLTGFVSIVGTFFMVKTKTYRFQTILTAIICFVIFLVGIYSLVSGQKILEVLKSIGIY